MFRSTLLLAASIALVLPASAGTFVSEPRDSAISELIRACPEATRSSFVPGKAFKDASPETLVSMSQFKERLAELGYFMPDLAAVMADDVSSAPHTTGSGQATDAASDCLRPALVPALPALEAMRAIDRRLTLQAPQPLADDALDGASSGSAPDPAE